MDNAELLRRIFLFMRSMYIITPFIRFFLQCLLPCMSYGTVASLFSGFFIFVYICVPTASKAPISSKKGLLHPTILVGFDRRKLSKVV